MAVFSAIPKLETAKAEQRSCGKPVPENRVHPVEEYNNSDCSYRENNNSAYLFKVHVDTVPHSSKVFSKPGRCANTHQALINQRTVQESVS